MLSDATVVLCICSLHCGQEVTVFDVRDMDSASGQYFHLVCNCVRALTDLTGAYNMYMPHMSYPRSCLISWMHMYVTCLTWMVI